PASRSSASRTSPRRRTTASARESVGGSSGARPRTEVPHLPPRGDEALPQGRALPDGEVRDRASLVSAGRARPRPHQAERVPAAAAREAEGSPLLRAARAAVPRVLREGVPPLRRHGRRAAAHARDAARQRRVPPRLRRVARAGAPTRPPRALPSQRTPSEHSELPGSPERRRHRAAELVGAAGDPRRYRPRVDGGALAP